MPPSIASNGRGRCGQHVRRRVERRVVAPPPAPLRVVRASPAARTSPAPMISAPMPGSVAARPSRHRHPRSRPARRRTTPRPNRVAIIHSWSRWPAWPNGASSDRPSPVANPSSEIEKLWAAGHAGAWRLRPRLVVVGQAGGPAPRRDLIGGVHDGDDMRRADAGRQVVGSSRGATVTWLSGSCPDRRRERGEAQAPLARPLGLVHRVVRGRSSSSAWPPGRARSSGGCR